ncbi:hypothetical protein [Lysinibacillus fusiformis]|uniref:Uncharacterized protein n=1 Tax=Lysinibacillus fusiformis TaxID=28031 RepID=A0A2I0UV72_9BACI|nr:hypothetical protein [Lysinibacillus fusiformis]PKU49967.1 hypothetical protein CRI88_20490 [Lysinibacillus fusiformis]
MFLGYKSVEEYKRDHVEKVTIDEIVELKQVNKRARRCKNCSTLVKYDSEGNKAWFYIVDPHPDAMEFMEYHAMEFCTKECVVEYFTSEFNKPFDIFMEEFNEKLGKHHDEVIQLIEKSL